jgi:hypothetical protein
MVSPISFRPFRSKCFSDRPGNSRALMGPVIVPVWIARPIATAPRAGHVPRVMNGSAGAIADHPIGFGRGRDGDPVCGLNMPSYRVANN